MLQAGSKEIFLFTSSNISSGEFLAKVKKSTPEEEKKKKEYYTKKVKKASEVKKK